MHAPRGTTPPLSVAPMMDRTDRHFRWLVRQVTRRTLLYTEMIPTGAILHGDRARHLGHDPVERPLAIQLGGDDPRGLAECARIAVDWGYDEVDLNVGCPSSRVRDGCFGAALMKRPGLVARAVEAMRAAVDVPVTVKHRIGVDEQDAYDDLLRFVDVVTRAGSDRFTVHARKAWLSGLSPKQNRTVPPLRYDDVYRLKAERPGLAVVLNGGVAGLDAVRRHLGRVDGVMVGRAAYADPWLLATADAELFGEPATEPPTRAAVAERLVAYAEAQVARGARLHPVVRHANGLMTGVPGARRWRQAIADAARPGARPADLLAAIAAPA